MKKKQKKTMKWDEAPFICKLFKINKTDYPTKCFFFPI